MFENIKKFLKIKYKKLPVMHVHMLLDNVFLKASVGQSVQLFIEGPLQSVQV
jgi:hypothetical protein